MVKPCRHPGFEKRVSPKNKNDKRPYTHAASFGTPFQKTCTWTEKYL